MAAQRMNSESYEMRCPVCRENTSPAGMTHHHVASHVDATYTLHGCPSCKLEFWTPLKAIPEVYADEVFDAYVDYHAGTRPFPRWAEPMFLETLPGHGSSLDIGCGDGAVVARLAAMGLDAHGIDLDAKSIQAARRKHGCEHVQVATLDGYASTCKEKALEFSLISFFEVLEHQDEPLTFLEKVREVGEPDALVVGSVPNRHRFLARLDRKLSDGDLPPHHFLWFSRDSLAYLLRQAGFERINIIRTGALPYRLLITKVAAALRRKTKRWPMAPVLSVVGSILAPLLALVPWAGGQVAPSHLYFSCRARALEKPSQPASPGD